MPPALAVALLVAVGFVSGVVNTLAGGGTLLTVPAMILLWNFPITPAVQRRIRRLIERRIAIEEKVRMRRQAARTT